LEQLTPDQLFLTFDTSVWSDGCMVDATITGGDGDSAPSRMARIVDVPTIEQFSLTDDGSGHYSATLVGLNLETIGKAGLERRPADAGLAPAAADLRRRPTAEAGNPDGRSANTGCVTLYIVAWRFQGTGDHFAAQLR
jgi:hypothetical protein